MLHIKEFESFNNIDSLIIVDVQKSFKRFFTEMYLDKLKKHTNKFSKVYYIWDNHHLGKNIKNNYLYDESPEIPIGDEIYQFNNVCEIIEKRYNYNVNIDFYKKILKKETYLTIKEKENKKELKKGDIFYTEKGTAIVYISNKHKWFHIPKKLLNIFKSYINKTIYIVGGSDLECLEDIYVAAESIGVKIKRDWMFIYSATNCPIK